MCQNANTEPFFVREIMPPKLNFIYNAFFLFQYKPHSTKTAQRHHPVIYMYKTDFQGFFLINRSEERERRNKEPIGWGKPPLGRCLWNKARALYICKQVQTVRTHDVHFCSGETTLAWLTLKVVTFSIHEDVVDHDDTEDAGPEMNVTEHEHKSDILGRRCRGQVVQTKHARGRKSSVEKEKSSLTYIKCIEEDKQWNLDHTDLHSNATAHFKAAEEKLELPWYVSTNRWDAVSNFPRTHVRSPWPLTTEIWSIHPSRFRWHKHALRGHRDRI